MLNVTNGKIIRLMVDGEPFQVSESNLVSYKRELDIQTGILTRSLVWRTQSGKELRIHSERLMSFHRRRVMAIRYTVTPLNFDGPITIVSALDGKVVNRSNAADPRVGAFFSGQVLTLEEKFHDGEYAALLQKTKTTRFALTCGMSNRLSTECDFKVAYGEEDQEVQVIYEIEGRAGANVTLEKMVSYIHSKHDEFEDELPSLARTEARKATKDGFEALKNEQIEFLKDFWSRTSVEIHGDSSTQQGLRFNLFHLLQSVARDGKANISAKGLTGEGYEGHYFWDSDAYVVPVFLYTSPDIAKALITHRYSLLDKARARARELSLKGALYAWRTIDGEELSAYFPAGTAQYHINADIAFSLKKYFLATQDTKFLFNEGAEMLFETARCWLSLGAYIRDRGFCINCVTGPDEYTALVDNNLYTNVMAKDHLEFAVYVAERMKREMPKQFQKIARLIGLDEPEVAEWNKAAESMYMHYDKELCIYGQDDTFLNKPHWDFRSVPDEKRPFLMHFHYLHIYRYQVLKQADVVQVMCFQGNRFTRLEKVRNYDYYEPLTTHDSSLSAAIHCIMAAELGNIDTSYKFFMETARMDLDDVHKNVRDGVHIANMAGTWMGLVMGFGGMRDYSGQLSFAPTLPKNWKGYSFRTFYRGRILNVSVARSGVTYELVSGEGFTILHRGIELSIEPGTSKTVPLRPAVKGVLFDLDGVLTDTAEYHYLAWKKLADELGVSFDREFNEQLKGVSRLDSLDLILAHGKLKVDPEERLRLADRKNGYYLELIKTMTPNDLLPNAKEFLEALRTSGIKTALVSASKNGPEVLKRLGIEQLFDYIVNPSTLSKGKPDPEIFLKAAEGLGFQPEECVGIEDAEAGIIAIKKAGMRSIGVGTPASMALADLVVSGVKDLTVESVHTAQEA
jgi:alpha,alpha-trehalose phosphorylase